jgi:hypothetical protein
MPNREKLSPDSDALRAIALMAGVPPARMAAAFSDPEHIYGHISLEELERIKAACERLGALGMQLAAATDIAMAAIAKGVR